MCSWFSSLPTPLNHKQIKLAQNIQAASRKLCHRQLSWFRDDERFRWVDATADEDAVVDEILALWAQPEHEGGCGDSGRLTHAQQQEMKQYVTRMEVLTPGSEGVAAAVAAARATVRDLPPLKD